MTLDIFLWNIINFYLETKVGSFAVVAGMYKLVVVMVKKLDRNPAVGPVGHLYCLEQRSKIEEVETKMPKKRLRYRESRIASHCPPVN